jgi:hypothetical protein
MFLFQIATPKLPRNQITIAVKECSRNQKDKE